MDDGRCAVGLHIVCTRIPCDTANAGVYQWRGRGLGASLLLRCCFTVREHTYTCRCQSNLLTGCQFTYDA